MGVGLWGGEEQEAVVEPRQVVEGAERLRECVVDGRRRFGQVGFEHDHAVDAALEEGPRHG